MIKKKLQAFIAKLDEQRIKKEGGTIYLTFEEFDKVFDYFEGQMVSPGGAAGMLRVSRAMIHQLEKDGRIRAYRINVNDKALENIPRHLRLFIRQKDQYIWIPVDDLVKHAQEAGKGDLPFIKEYLNTKKKIEEFYKNKANE